MGAILSGIQSHEVRQIWPFIAPMMQEAVDERGDGWTAEDIERCLDAGEMQLWLATSQGLGIEAALVTRIFVKEERVCSIFAAVGDGPDRWVSLLPVIEEWARASGCRKFYVEGRPGWKKKLPGYRMTRVVLEKDLT